MECETKNVDLVGESYGDFLLTKKLEIKEINCVLRELEHKVSGAQVMHLENDDPENVFCLSFRTLPESSNGIAHILEHTVLCGSEKFPVKDPFFSMNRRSLNTFMNAFTGSDFTCYPAASQVKKDFYNLLEVYSDSVFRPNLHELSFSQEGHRLEFESLEESSSLLKYAGVVFNEMKGSLSSPDSRLWKELRAKLFPDLTYGWDSGGDPKVIPELSYQEFLDFHRKYYHPSRCIFFFYGNLPLQEHLDFIEEKSLKGVERLSPIEGIPRQKRMGSPKSFVSSFPAVLDGEKEDQEYFALAWLTCHILEQEELLGLSVLDIILTGTDAAPLKYALLQSGFCKQVETALEEDISEIPFAVIMKGCSPNKAEDLEKIAMDALRRVAEDGIPVERVEAAVHQLELFRREITGDPYPFGLSLFLRSALLKQHGGKAEDALRVDSLFQSFRKKAEDPSYLTGLLRKYFLDNPHFVKLVMRPEGGLSEKESREEKEKLHRIKSKLSQEEMQGIIQRSLDLVALQEKREEDDLEILPKVTLSDVPEEAKDFSLMEEDLGGLRTFRHECFTNSFVYADVVLDLPSLKKEELPYLRMFSWLLPQIGCGGRDYRSNLEYIQEHTGGIGMALSLNSQAQDFDFFKPALNIGGKSLCRKMDKLFPLLRDFLLSADFKDVARLKELVLKQYTILEASLNRNALKYASSLATSALSLSSLINNYWYGLEYFWSIRELAKNFDERASQFVEKMLEFQDRLLLRDKADLVISSDGETYKFLKENSFFGLGEIKGGSCGLWEVDYPLMQVSSQGRIISSPVGFTCSALKGLHYTHPDAPALSVASFIFDNKTLHKRVREQGGAYGSGAVNSLMSGNFYFYSYRDPHLFNTLSAFKEAVVSVAEGKFDERDLEEAKLGIIQGLDSPVSPGGRGMTAYAWKREGKSLKARKKFRDDVLSVAKESLCHAVDKHISSKIDSLITVSFSEKGFFERENAIILEKGREALQILEV